jgi:hypothetical protein
MKKPVPEFRSEDQERAIWATEDSTEYVDWRQAKRVKVTKLKATLY